MNLKPTFPLLGLLLCAALHTPAFAQSGSLHFQGRIVAPVCSGTLFAEQSPPDAVGAQEPTFSLDTTGCENNAGGFLAHIRVSRHEDPQAPHANNPRAGQNNPDTPMWTMTYH